MKKALLIICGLSLTRRESSTTCAASAKRRFGIRSASTCNIASIAVSETANVAVKLSTQIHGTLSSMHEMQSRQTITVTLALTMSPRRPNSSSRGTKNVPGSIRWKKPLRLNSASSESLNPERLPDETGRAASAEKGNSL